MVDAELLHWLMDGPEGLEILLALIFSLNILTSCYTAIVGGFPSTFVWSFRRLVTIRKVNLIHGACLQFSMLSSQRKESPHKLMEVNTWSTHGLTGNLWIRKLYFNNYFPLDQVQLPYQKIKLGCRHCSSFQLFFTVYCNPFFGTFCSKSIFQ